MPPTDLARQAKFCHACGNVIDARLPTCPECKAGQYAIATAEGESDARLFPAVLLCVLVGFVGAHRFYDGKRGTAILQLCTLGGLGLWTLVDLILLVTGSFKDAEGRKISAW